MNLICGHLEFSYFFNLSRSYRRLGESDEMGQGVSWAPKFPQNKIFMRINSLDFARLDRAVRRNR